MLPRLQAEEQLAAIEATGLGTGSYEARDSRRVIRRLRDKATGQSARPLRGAPANPAQLAAIGIGMVSAPPERPLSDA